MEMAKLKQMKELLADTHVRGKIDRAVETAKEIGWASWFNGVPVQPELETYMNMLSNNMKRMKFYPVEFTQVWKTHVDGTHTHHFIVDEFSAYMDEYPFDLGRVGYRNYSVDGDANTYGVYSRKITNAKYRGSRDQYNMMLTNDMKKAVKLASTYLVPYSTKELATAYYKHMQANVEAVHERARNAANEVVSNIRGDSKIILAELMHLKSMGVKFKTEQFITASEKIEDAYNLAREESQRTDDVRKSYNAPRISSPSTTYSMSDLPEDIVRSISVLSILNDKQYVPRVGQKIDEYTYWIERG
jgi:hypothetical protein